jgi:hypothetical protein
MRVAGTGLELRLVPVIEQFRDQLRRTGPAARAGGVVTYDADEVVDQLRSRYREYERYKKQQLRPFVERGAAPPSARVLPRPCSPRRAFQLSTSCACVPCTAPALRTYMHMHMYIGLASMANDYSRWRGG